MRGGTKRGGHNEWRDKGRGDKEGKITEVRDSNKRRERVVMFGGREWMEGLGIGRWDQLGRGAAEGG